MEKVIVGPQKFEFKCAAVSQFPMLGRGKSNSFFTDKFEMDILKYSSGTCGNPAVCSSNCLAAFLTNKGGYINCDGNTIKLDIPEGQKVLYIDDNRSEKEKWARYKELIELPDVKKVKRQDFWLLPEYVTWMEQKYEACMQKSTPREVFNQKFVENFMDRIIKLGYPKGKLTLDDGWQETFGDREWTDGYWRIDKNKFPDMKGLCDKIKANGFIPSIWMGIPSVPRTSKIIKEKPELFEKDLENQKLLLAEFKLNNDRYYFMPSDLLTEHFVSVISPLADMGFRKFKFDFFYGPRYLMRGIIKCVHDAVRKIDPTIEIESHHADPFFSCYCDTFRMNDVIPSLGYDWMGMTLSHINLANNIATDCIINLDHAGGNNALISEDDFLKHLKLFEFVEKKYKYPVVSLLPDRFSLNAQQKLKKFIEKNMC